MAPTDLPNRTRSRADSHRYALICGCFALSGLAALIYQTAWTRQFALVFGTSELAVATVLAAYMAGLALGARLVEGVLPRVSQPVRLYAALELGIGVAALALVPLCLWLAERLLIALLGGQAEPPSTGAAGNTVFYLVAGFLTLLVPTALMGATLPILARAGVHDDAQIGSRIGALYACNSAGAVLGALLTALLLLPAWGLRRTIWTAAGVNVLVFALACGLLRLDAMRARLPTTTAAEGKERAAAAPAEAVPPHQSMNWILPLILLSGSVSFLHEVLWTRLLQRLVGSSIQAFGVMVASFLFGIALGGALGARLARDRERAAFCFVAAQVGIAAAAVLAWLALTGWTGVPQTGGQRIGFGFLVLLPLSLAIGVTYPLAVRVLARGVADAPVASARIYSWNTMGAILGALAGGFWIIPALRYEGSVQCAVVASLALAVIACFTVQRFNWRRAAPVMAAALVLGILFRPAAPEDLLRISPLRHGRGSLVYYAVGRSADVVVVRDESLLELRTNGLPEAGMPVLGAPPTANVESWMSMLAVLARPDIATMLIVGLGGGNAVQAVPPSVRRVDVIEIEPEVIAANRAIAGLRQHDPLNDDRIHLIINDARGALTLSPKLYDAIVSQPSHPWTAGASHLYTREFLRRAHDHLTAGGVFVQWMGSEFVDESLLRSLVATLGDVFGQVRVYRPSNTTLLFMASDQSLDMELKPQSLRSVLDRSPLHYARVGLNAPEDLIAALSLPDAEARRFSAGSALITDDDNRLATANVYERRRGLNGERVAGLLAPFDPLTHAESFIYRDLVEDLSFEYIWRRAVLWAAGGKPALERMNRVADLLGETDRAVLLRYMAAMHDKQAKAAAELLRDGLRRWPDSVPLLYALAETQVNEQARGSASGDLPSTATRLSGDPALVIDLTRAVSDQQWDRVAAADDRLADIDWTAQWGPQAAQLRTEWRMSVKTPELRQQLGTQGIVIADRAEVSQPDVFWHARRAWSAAGTNRPAVVLESIAMFCVTAEQSRGKLAAPEVKAIRDRGAGLLTLIGQLQDDSRVDAWRVIAVRDRLTKVVDSLQ